MTQLWGCGGQPQSGPGVGFRLLVPGWAVMGTLQVVLGWMPPAQPCQGSTAQAEGTKQPPKRAPSALQCSQCPYPPTLGVCLCAYFCVYACMCMSVQRCMCVCTHVYAYAHRCVYTRVCARVPVHAHVRVGVCTAVHMGWGELC